MKSKSNFDDYKISKGKLKWIDAKGRNASDWVICNKLTWIIATIFGATVLAVTLSFIFPAEIGQLDNKLKPLSNIVPVMSLLFAIGAMFIAFMSYKSSILRPHLNLRFAPLQQTGTEVHLSIDKQGLVTGGRPLTEWEMWLENDGESSAKYPMVRIFFIFINHEGKYFAEKSFPGWSAVSHAYGKGYCGFQWSCDKEILYPGFSVKLPTMYMLGKYFEGDFSVEISYVADGAPKTTISIPVKVSRLGEK